MTAIILHRWPARKVRRPNPNRLARWLSRHVIGYAADATPIYGGVALTDTRRRVIAWSIGAEWEIIRDA